MKDHAKLWQLFDSVTQKSGTTPIVFAACQAAKPAVQSKNRTLQAVVLTDRPNRRGLQWVIEGGNLTNYKKNPVVLWLHGQDPNHPEPIGQAISIGRSTLENGVRAIVARDRFLEAELNPFADRIFQLYEAGVLRAFSIGAIVDKFETVEDEEGLVQGLRVLKWEMLEHSAVPVGADALALVKQGLVTPVVEQIAELHGRPVVNLDFDEVERRTFVDMGKVAKELLDAAQTVTASTAVPDQAVEVTQSAAVVEGDEAVAEDVVVQDAVEHEDRSEPAGFASIRRDELVEEAAGHDVELQTAVPFSAHGKVPTADRDTPWDAAAARRALAKWASSDGSGDKDKINFRRYRLGFLRFDADRADNVTAYQYPHHTVRDGRLVSVFRGVAAAAQRFIQFQNRIPESERGTMRAHLTREYALFDEKPPWQRQSGIIYEEMHARLRQAQDPDEVAELRETIKQLGRLVFGEHALNEPWEREERDFSDLGPVRGAIAGALDARLVDLGVDEELRDDLTWSLLQALDPVLSRLESEKALLAKLMEMTGSHNGEELLDAVDGLVALREQMDAPLSQIVDKLEQTVRGKVDGREPPIDSIERLEKVIRSLKE